IGCKPIGSGSWMPTVGACLTGSGLGLPMRLTGSRLTSTEPGPSWSLAHCLCARGVGTFDRALGLVAGFSCTARTYPTWPQPLSPNPDGVVTFLVFSAFEISLHRRSDREERDDQAGSLHHLHPRLDRARA